MNTFVEELLKRVGEHPKSVLIALLGIMAAGSIAGWLWIQNLTSTLAERDKLAQARLELLGDKHAQELRTLAQANAVLQAQMAIVRDSSGSVAKSLQEIAALAGAIGERRTVSRETAVKLQSSARDAAAQAAELNRALQRAADVRGLLQNLVVAQSVSTEVARVEHKLLTPFAILIAGLATVVMGLAVVYAEYFRKGSKSVQPSPHLARSSAAGGRSNSAQA